MRTKLITNYAGLGEPLGGRGSRLAKLPEKAPKSWAYQARKARRALKREAYARGWRSDD